MQPKQLAGVKLILNTDTAADHQVIFGTSQMLIYLDTMIVQHISDYFDYVYQDIASEYAIPNPVSELKLAAELTALRRLVFVEQFFDWVVAAPSHLMDELLSGKPTHPQLETYKTLSQAWKDSLNWENKNIEPNEEMIISIDNWLISLNLRDKPDRRNLAEAIALQASWFLTNDKNIIKRVNQKRDELRDITDDIALPDPDLNANQILKRLLSITRVARPSEFIAVIEERFLFP